jgi:hypothetical protein
LVALRILFHIHTACLAGFYMLAHLLCHGYCLFLHGAKVINKYDYSNMGLVEWIRCNWKGEAPFNKKVLWSTTAYNIRVMTAAIVAKL